MTEELEKLDPGLARVYVNEQGVVVGGAYDHTKITDEEKAGGTEVIVWLDDWFAVEAAAKVVEADGTIRAATKEEELSVTPVPTEISRYQFLTQLAIQGDLVVIKSFVDSLGIEMQARFDTAPSFHRAHPLFNAALPALATVDSKFTMKYMDLTFIEADKIVE